MKLNRKIINIIYSKNDNDDGYVNAKTEERFSMVWEITRDVWSFGGKADVEQRLQRNVTNLIRRKG